MISLTHFFNLQFIKSTRFLEALFNKCQGYFILAFEKVN